MRARTVRRREERREEIVAAARSLFAERGYEGTAVSAIVARAGVAQGTFYLYFPSKEHVLAAVIDQVSREMEADLRAALEAPGTPEEVIGRALNVVGAFYRRHGQLLTITPFRTTVPEGEDCRLLSRRRLAEPVAAFIRRGMAAGTLHAGDPDLAARLIIGMVQEALYCSLLPDDPVSPEDLVGAIRELILKALAPTSGQALSEKPH